jgi:integrative and conjugative element protein (TIGR02256 family)
MNKVVELDDITLTIEANVMYKFLEHIQDTNLKPESGGILIGYYIDEYSFIITDISTPTDNDICSRYSFIRSHKNAQRFIKQKFEKSNGKKIYLGEWHTHPENCPTPSNVDILSYKRQLNTNILNSKITFMVIVGLLNIYVGVYKNDTQKNREYISYLS